MAKVCNAVITGTILVCYWMTNMLFDLGSTYSYLSMRFTTDNDINCDIIDAPISVSSLDGD